MMADRKPLVSVNGRTKELPGGDRINAGLISDFAATVRSTVLTGLSTATNAVIAATDTVLQALGKLQAQVSTKAADSNVLHLSSAGYEHVSTLKYFDGGIISGCPTDFWVYGSAGNGASFWGSEGYFGTNGSFAMSFRSNGYRNSSGSWTSLGRGGNAGASGIDLRPTGEIWFGAYASAIPGIDVPWRWKLTQAKLTPMIDNALDLAESGNRIREIFASNATINTSDAREKTTPRHLSPQELAAALDIARLPCVFQWLGAVEEKGEAARLHAGPTVQDVIAAMESHGLDPFRYGFVCYDEWDEQPEVTETEPAEHDEEGNVIREEQTIVVQEYRPAGNRYSLRPSELAHFIQAALVQEQDSIKARLAALEEA